MTYKELKQKAEKLGINCRFHNLGTTVNLVGGDGFVVTFYELQPYDINIYLKATANSNKIHRLLDLCCELAKTPSEKRGNINDL